MKRPSVWAMILVYGSWLTGVAGCGSGHQGQSISQEEQVNAKVAAIKRLADAMAKDPNGIDARGALEDYQVTGFDAQQNPKQAEEILEVYRTRIQGKYKGDVAQQVQAAMTALQSSLKHK